MVRFKDVKNVLRLVLFYLIAFLFFLLLGTGVSTMRVWMDGAFGIPPHSISVYSTVLYFLGATLPAAAFGASLLVIPNGMRRGPLLTGTVVLFLSTAVLTGVTYGTSVLRRTTVPAPRDLNAQVLGAPGLIVDYSEASLIYLDDPGNGLGKAVVAKAGAPLRVTSAREAQASVQRMRETSPFGPSLETPATFSSLERVFSGAAHRLSLAGQEGLMALLAYSLALALLMASFSPFAGVTKWPLADLVLCAIFYRGLLEFEGIVASGPVVRFASALGLGVPQDYLVPGMLGAVGLLILVAGSLVRFLSGRREPSDA